MEPLKSEANLLGKPTEKYVQELVLGDRFLRQKPREAIKILLQAHKIDPREFMGEPVNGTPQAPLSREWERLNSETQSIKDYLKTQQITAQRQFLKSLEDEVEAFSKETDNAGQSLFPYFEEVQQDMIPLVSSLRTRNPNMAHKAVLKEAYDQAIWANANIREKLLEAQKVENEAKKEALAEKARNASSSIKGSPDGTPQKSLPANNLREMLRLQLEGRY